MKKSHAYIFVHDQDIIQEYETTRKLRKIFGSDYTYVFVGMKTTDALTIFECHHLPGSGTSYRKNTIN